MTLSTKMIVAPDIGRARRDVKRAIISVKNSSARSDVLLKLDKALIARSRGQIANVGDRFNPKNAPDSSRREMLERHLEQAKRHAAIGEKHLTRQRELIAELERDSHDAGKARELLELFEEVQAMHIAHRDDRVP